MNVALIGLGSMGKNHFRVLKKFPEIELIAVCDPRLNGSFKEPTYASVDALLQKEQLDAAIICVPTSMHAEIALQCIENGISVLIEKPLATDIEEGLKISEAVAKNNVKAAVGHIERFNPAIVSLLSELEGKRIYSINITRIGPFPPRINDVGVLVDLSVHDIDLIRYLTHRKRIVESRVFKSHRCKTGNGFEDNAVISMKLEDNIIASITTNWLTPFKKRMVEVATDKAYYEANLMTQELREYSEYQTNTSFVVRDCRVIKEEPLAKELESFIRYVETGDRGNLASVEDGLKTLEIISKRRNGFEA